MKYTASKWPITITYEVAEDWFEGINSEQLNCSPCDSTQELIQEAANDAAEQFIKAKGLILARQEAERKQLFNQQNDNEVS